MLCDNNKGIANHMPRLQHAVAIPLLLHMIISSFDFFYSFQNICH